MCGRSLREYTERILCDCVRVCVSADSGRRRVVAAAEAGQRIVKGDDAPCVSLRSDRSFGHVTLVDYGRDPVFATDCNLRKTTAAAAACAWSIVSIRAKRREGRNFCGLGWR